MTDTHDTKVCSKCREEKTLDCFYSDKSKKDGKGSTCKVCSKIYGASYYVKNKDRISTKAKQNYEKNKKEISAKRKQVYINNIDIIKNKRRIYVLKNKNKIKDTRASYYEKNKEKINLVRRKYRQKNLISIRNYEKASKNKNKDKINNYCKTKRFESSRYRISQDMRNIVSKAFKRFGYSKTSKTHEILGCSWDELKAHIESQFWPGMTWENRSEWHIDHKIPLASAKTEEDVIRLNHYTNLQPLWAADNIRKSDKLDHPLCA